MALERYRRKRGAPVQAVKLDLDTEGFRFQKWGGEQWCKGGDWIVFTGKDTYTVDADVFARTYRLVSPGFYEKTGPVWARRAETAGAVETYEGRSGYEAGDFLVYNDPDERDGWCMKAQRFAELYEPASEENG